MNLSGILPEENAGDALNRYLMLTVAALLGSTSGAMASQVKLTTQGCDVWTITWHGDLYAAVEDYRSCGSSVVAIGLGVAPRTKGFRRSVTLSSGCNTGVICADSWPTSHDFQLPFVTGKEVCTYYTTNGRTVTDAGCSTYTVLDPGKQRPEGSPAN